MTRRTRWNWLSRASAALALCLVVSAAHAGSPLYIQSDGTPFKWSTAGSIPYSPDGGSLGLWNNATAVTNVGEAFNRWRPDLGTSALTFSNAGGIPGDGDVNTVAEFNALDGNCADGISPVIFDADGSLFAALGLPSSVIAFAGPDCAIFSTGTITQGFAAVNGKWFDGNPTNGELSLAEFKGTLVHEFGHWLNLDHSQVNGHYFLGDTDPGFTAFGPPPLSSVEVMFPFAIGGATTPRKDDVATISRLYPAGGFSAATGTIAGPILYQTGSTAFQGANVIARNVADPYNDAVSNVSGVPYAAPATAGSYELPGLTSGASYAVEMVNVNSQFTAGSGLGPFDPPVVIPAPEEFYNGVNESSTNPPDNVSAYTSVASIGGVVTAAIDIVMNGTPADLSLAMIDSPDPTAVGQNLTYTLTVTNGGPGAATGVTLTDTLPGGVTYVSATPSQGICSQAAGVVTCSLGSVGSGATRTVTIVVTPTAAGTITNAATVTANESDSNTANNSASVTTTVNPASADLSVTITDAPDPVAVGGSLTYTVTIANSGPSVATDVTLTDPLPAGVTFGSATATVGTCSQAGGTVTCALGSVAGGTGATVTIVVTPTATGTLSNTANVSSSTSDPNTGNNTTPPVTTTVNLSANLAVTQVDSPDPVPVGSDVTYAITVSNGGPNTATNVTLTDTLPTAVTFVSATTPGPGTCAAPSGDVFTCSLGSLANGASATITLVVTTATAGMIGNTASVTAAESDPNSANNTSIGATNVGDVSRLINLSTRGPVLTSPNVIYGGFILRGNTPKRLLIRGRGPSMSGAPFFVPGTLANPKIDVYSGQTVIARNDNWQTTDPLCLSPATACGDSSQITATGLDPCQPNPGQTVPPPGCSNEAAVLITLPPGPYTVIMSGVNGGTGVGLFGVTDLDTGTTPKLINASTRGVVQASPNLMHGGFIIGAGTGSKTVVIRGRGPSMSGAPFFVPGTLANPKIELYSGQTVIARNDNWQTTDPLCLSPATACGNAAQITATGLDPCQPNPGQTVAPPGCANEAALLVTLPPGPYTVIMSGVNGGTGAAQVGLTEVSADLAITKVASPNPVTVGNPLTYTLTVTNNSTYPGTGATVLDRLPAGVTLVSATATQGSCTLGSTVTCNLGSVANGTPATVTIVVTPTTSGTITNTASVTGTLADPDTTNNMTPSVPTTVNP